MKVKLFLRHIFQRKRPVQFWREQGALTRRSWNQRQCRAHIQGTPHDLTLSPGRQVHRTRQAYTYQSHACELMDVHFRADELESGSRWVMADFGQSDFGQSDFGQPFLLPSLAKPTLARVSVLVVWPTLAKTDFGQTDFGQNRLWPNRL